ncbi:hypothetical protein JCM1840_004271 [Sporobolomyces johnsonii]
MGVNLSYLPPDSPPAVLHVAKLTQASNYVSVAVFSMAVWDWLVCLPREINLLWKARCSLVSFLTLVNRYAGLATGAVILGSALSGLKSESRQCNALPIAATLSGACIMGLRATAIWGFNRILIAGVAFGVFVESVCTLLSLTKWRGTHMPDGIVGCYPGVKPGHLWPVLLFSTPIIAVDCALFALTSFKAFSIWRAAEGRTTFAAIILRDGVIYYFLVVTINITAYQKDPALGLLVGTAASVGSTVFVLVSFRPFLFCDPLAHPKLLVSTGADSS